MRASKSCQGWYNVASTMLKADVEHHCQIAAIPSMTRSVRHPHHGSPPSRRYVRCRNRFSWGCPAWMICFYGQACTRTSGTGILLAANNGLRAA